MLTHGLVRPKGTRAPVRLQPRRLCSIRQVRDTRGGVARSRSDHFLGFRISPLTRRRIDNFKANRRGVWSLWIFLALFGVSLIAEVIANDRPADNSEGSRAPRFSRPISASVACTFASISLRGRFATVSP